MTVEPTPRPTATPTWIGALRLYLGVMAGGNLAWEFVHLPLYTIAETGTFGEQLFAVVHCTLGDLLIGVSTLTLALLIRGSSNWPHAQFRAVAVLTITFGIGYTVFSEWLNVVVRASWAYSSLMPVLPLFGMTLGLSPVLQWLIVPTAAFAVVRRTMNGSAKEARNDPM